MEKYLEKLEKISRENHIPIIKDDGCDFLIEFCKKNSPKNILEIGTAVGYSGSFMLLSAKYAHLTTIEKNTISFNEAKNTFSHLNLSNRVTQILGDAGEEIKKLQDKYDLIFLDGPKGQYIHYLPILLDLLTKDGTLIADNVLYRGLIRSDEYVKHKHRTMVVNLRLFLKEIETSDKLITKVYDIGDGIAVIRKK